MKILCKALVVLLVAQPVLAQDLTKAEVQELSNLAKSYKSVLAGYEVKLNEQQALIVQMKEDQVTLNHDLTKINDELREEVKSLQSQQLFMWIGIGAAALIGLVVK